MWLDIILIIVALILFINNMSLRSSLKWSKEYIELLKSANSKLVTNLENANLKIKELTQDSDPNKHTQKIPAFLLADDPMEAILRDVGKAKR